MSNRFLTKGTRLSIYLIFLNLKNFAYRIFVVFRHCKVQFPKLIWSFFCIGRCFLCIKVEDFVVSFSHMSRFLFTALKLWCEKVAMAMLKQHSLKMNGG